MEGYCETRFLIDPVDVPFVFKFLPDPQNPSIEPFWSSESVDWDVRISGRLHDLIDLFEGQVDGDALFFSRALTIEGDTSAVLALRNAIDSEEIKLVEEVAAKFGPFGAPVRVAGENVPGLVSRSYNFIEGVRNRVLDPVVDPLKRSNENLRKEVGKLKTEMAAMRAQTRKRAVPKGHHAKA